MADQMSALKKSMYNSKLKNIFYSVSIGTSYFVHICGCFIGRQCGCVHQQ